MSATRAATVGRDVSQNRKQAKPGLSVSTLMIASLSSLAAAVVVSRLWGGGTLIGAAMTPVIVALVSEGLNRPAKAIGTVPKAIGTVRQTRGGRYDPVAEGRAGLREGDFDGAGTPPVPAAAAAQIRVHRASTTKQGVQPADAAPARPRGDRDRPGGLPHRGGLPDELGARPRQVRDLVVAPHDARAGQAQHVVLDDEGQDGHDEDDGHDDHADDLDRDDDHAAGREHPGAERDDADRPARAAAADRARGAAADDDGPGRAADHARRRRRPRRRRRRRSRYASAASFGEVQGAASFPASTSGSSSIATRSWVSVSRSRTVTVRSSSDWWSIVTHHGVPISSWRR